MKYWSAKLCRASDLTDLFIVIIQAWAMIIFGLSIWSRLGYENKSAVSPNYEEIIYHRFLREIFSKFVTLHKNKPVSLDTFSL